MAERGIRGIQNAAKMAGFGVAEEELFTRMCRVVEVAEGGLCGGGVRSCDGGKKGLLVV